MDELPPRNLLLATLLFGAGGAALAGGTGFGGVLLAPLLSGVAGNLLTDSYKAAVDWYSMGKAAPDAAAHNFDLRGLAARSVLDVVKAARRDFDGHTHGRDLLDALAALPVRDVERAMDLPRFASLGEDRLLEFIGAPHGGIDDRAATGSTWAALLCEAVRIGTPQAVTDPAAMTDGQRAGLALAARRLWERFPAQLNGRLRDDPKHGARALVAVQTVMLRTIADRVNEVREIAGEQRAQFRSLCAWLVGSADGLSATGAEVLAESDGTLIESLRELRTLAWTSLANVDKTLAGVYRVETAVEEIRRIVAGGPRLASLNPPVPKEPTLVYRDRRVPLVCRGEHLDELRTFLYSEQDVAWWVWHGPAGIGKSRLAFELCREIDRSWAGEESGWVAGFLSLQGIETRDWSAWRPAKPTLIIVDYASGKAEDLRVWIAQVARAAAERGGKPWHWVRFLLLDRDAQPRWLDRLVGTGDDKPWVAAARYKADGEADAPHRELERFSDDDLLRVVRAVYSARDSRVGEAAGAGLRPAPEAVVERFRQGQVALRPLFVTLAAEAACDGKSIEKMDEESLVRDWLAEGFRQWARLAGEKEEHSARMLALRSLAAVGTMAQGVMLPKGYGGLLRDIDDTGAVRLLPPDSPYSDPVPLVRKFLSVEENPSRLPPMEPDYFGEVFVLDHFDRHVCNEGDRSALLAAAAKASPEGVVRFLFLADQDFPEHSANPNAVLGTLPAEERAAAHFRLGCEWTWKRNGNIAANRAKAIAVFEASLSVYTRDTAPINWAATQINLGNAWRELPTGDQTENLRKAIAAYEAALTVYTREIAPINWATTQNNLGIAWQNLPTGDRTDNLRKAMAAYEAALTVRTREAAPLDWAITQNNLGTTWQDLPTGDRAENLRRAITAFEAALSVQTPDAAPFDWAMTQNNLGIAWTEVPTGNRTDNLRKAIAAFEAALTVHTREAAPHAWATTQNNMGIAWKKLPTSDRDGDLRKAITAFEAALTVHTRETAPFLWAMTQNNLGVAWRALLAGDRAAHLGKSIAALTAALTVRTREDAPFEWARTQHNLGDVWEELPTGDRAENLRKAIAAYEAALTVRTRETAPFDWAATQNSLGIAWGKLPAGDLAENERKAIVAFEAALTVYTRDAAPLDWAMTQLNLAISIATLAQKPGDDCCGLLRRAIGCAKAALTVKTEEAFPNDYARMKKVLDIIRQRYEAIWCDSEAGGERFEKIEPAR